METGEQNVSYAGDMKIRQTERPLPVTELVHLPKGGGKKIGVNTCRRKTNREYFIRAYCPSFREFVNLPNRERHATLCNAKADGKSESGTARAVTKGNLSAIFS